MTFSLTSCSRPRCRDQPACPRRSWRGEESPGGGRRGIFSSCDVWENSCGDNHQHLALSSLRLLAHTSSLSFTHPHINHHHYMVTHHSHNTRVITTQTPRDVITVSNVGGASNKILSEFPSRSGFVLGLIKSRTKRCNSLRGETQNRDCT